MSVLTDVARQNVVLIDDSATVPACFPDHLVPATTNNINELKRFVLAVSVAAADKLLGAFSKAEEILEATDAVVMRREKMRTPEYLEDEERLARTDAEKVIAKTACRNYRCEPMHEYLILVSDGEFGVDDVTLKQLGRITKRRSLLHTMSIAVGKDKDVNKFHLTQIACVMNGAYFHIKPIPDDQRHKNGSKLANGIMSHESYVLNELNEYFQLIASPLARNHSVLNGKKFDPRKPLHNLSLDVTWSLPTADSLNEAVVVTIALPCFGDSDKHTPRLLGVVAVDLLFLLPGERFGNSLVSGLGLVYHEGHLPR